EFCAVAQAGQMRERSLGVGSETRQLPGHQVHHVVRIAFGANAIQVPGPSLRDMVESEQALFKQRRKKLDREEWIAAGLSVYEFGERTGMLWSAAKGVCNELVEVLMSERRQDDVPQ